MKTRMKFLVFAALILAAATATLVSCGKDNKANKGNPPNETSTYWSDAYRQHQLKGKVKTIKTFGMALSFDEWKVVNGNYDFLEFDNNGNLIREGDVESGSTRFRGSYLFYDAQNRLTKLNYGNFASVENMSGDEVVEVLELGYDGNKHNIYFPTNFALDDLRLQKGITSLFYKEKDKIWADIKCTSVSSNHLTFEGKFAGAPIKVEVDCEGNYPAHFEMEAMVDTIPIDERMQPLVNATFGAGGLPVKVEEFFFNTVAEFTTIAGFLLIAKEFKLNTPNKYTEYQYNEKGDIIYKKDIENGEIVREIRYAYSEYDSHGNWIKQTSEQKDKGGEWFVLWSNGKLREITYW
jgi:hypothetical protein